MKKLYNCSRIHLVIGRYALLVGMCAIGFVIVLDSYGYVTHPVQTDDLRKIFIYLFLFIGFVVVYCIMGIGLKFISRMSSDE
jgi:hypothetical protein